MTKHHPVFPPFQFKRWAAVDDRVRGGSSQSHLEAVEIDSTGHVRRADVSDDEEKQALAQAAHKRTIGARFWGTLDTKTLGGAGFASQRYMFGPQPLHLPRLDYTGMYVTVIPDQAKHTRQTPKQPNDFTLVLKTNLRSKPPSPPKVPPSPDPASLSYEVTFTAPEANKGDLEPKHFTFGWEEFKAVYRGREVGRDDPRYEVLDPGAIYEISLMCRSDFGKQEGDFNLAVMELGGLKKGGNEQESGARARDGCLKGISNWVRSFWSTGGEIQLPADRSSKL